MEYNMAFNILTQEFIDKLKDTFPEDRDFKLFDKGFRLIVRVNRQKPAQLFKDYINLYRNYILNRDDSYFMNNNTTNIINSDTNFSYQNKENTFIIVNKLKNYWTTLSANNKNVIWEYLIQMLKLSDFIR
jgi:hypothetical protein